MHEDTPITRLVDQFIVEQIDTVPHLEALLLFWEKRPKTWSQREIAAALFVPTELAGKILGDLVERNLVTVLPENQGFQYFSRTTEQDNLVASVAATYRRELVRISRMIHAKAPASIRDFARAFRFTKEKEKE